MAANEYEFMGERKEEIVFTGCKQVEASESGVWLTGSGGGPERDPGCGNEWTAVRPTDMGTKAAATALIKNVKFSFGMCEFLFQRWSRSRGW